MYSSVFFLFGCLLALENPFLTIDNNKYFLHDFYARYPKKQWQRADSLQKDKMLNDFIKRELCIIEGERLGFHNDPEVATKIRNRSKQVLVNEAYEAFVARPLIHEEDLSLARIYAKTEIKAKHILIGHSSSYLAKPPKRSVDEALLLSNKIKDEFEGGSGFGVLAEKYSEDPSVKDNAGDLGWVQWGATVPEFQLAAFQLEKGEISKPVLTDFGYHLILVSDLRPSDFNNMSDDAFEAVIFNITKNRVRDQLRGAAQHYDSLKLKNYGVVFNDLSINKIAAAFAGALFIAHPVLTSGVAYIFQRNGLLCSFFYMCGFYGLLKAFPVNRPPNQKWIVFAGGTSILSIWSKETGITFIVITLVFHFLLRPKDTRCDWQRWFYPLGGICMLSLVIVFWQMVRTPIMKRTIYGDWTVWQNIITQWNVITEYLSLILWPHPAKLNIDHDFPISLSIMDQNTWLSGVILITLLGYGFWLTERNRLMALGVFWFFITLAVESSVIPISEVMVEYRLYLSMFGFILFNYFKSDEVSIRLSYDHLNIL